MGGPQSQLLAGQDGEHRATAGRSPPLTRQTEQRPGWPNRQGSEPGGDGREVLARHLRELRLQVGECLTVSPALPVQSRGEETSGGIGQLRLQQSHGREADKRVNHRQGRLLQ